MQVSGDGGGTSWLDEASANFIKASEDRVASGGSGGGNIEFDADGIQKVIDELEDIYRNELQNAKTDAEHLFRTLPNNVDPVSGTYVRAVDDFGRRYEEWADQFMKSIKAYAKKLEKVKQTMEEREAEIGDAFSRTQTGD